jgi:hypothetical protein
VLLSETTIAADGQLVSDYKLEAEQSGVWKELKLTADAHAPGTCMQKQPGACGGKTIGSHHLDQLADTQGVTALRLTVSGTLVGGRPTIEMKAFLIHA